MITHGHGLCFTLEKWTLWQSEACLAEACWPCGEVLPHNAGKADVSFLPMMQRRRLSPLAKAAIAAAWPCGESFVNQPAVFCSIHGESQNYFELLTDLATAQEISPTRFSLSVHNAIAGLYSQFRGTSSPYIALAGGTESLFAAFLEAAGLILEGPSQRVLVVWYEQALPAVYRNHARGPDRTIALAMRLSAESPNGTRLRLRRMPSNKASAMAPACWLQEFCQAILKGERHSVTSEGQFLWHWRLEDA